MPFTTLISASQLHQCLSEPKMVVVDCQFDLADAAAGRAAYEAGHIAGARYAHLGDDLSSPITSTSGRHPLPNPTQLADKFGNWGINSQTQIVAYDNTSGAFASRLWWLARWLGHSAIAVLDGGLSAWIKAGFNTTTEVPAPTPATFTSRASDDLWLTTDAMLEKLAAGDLTIVDARKHERYLGKVEPIDPVAGHIPGAVNLPFADNWNSEGCFHTPEKLRQRFEGVADRPAPQIAHSCGSGITACVNLLAMEHAGLPNSKLYAGSWSEYIRDTSRPVATHPS